jgi:AcrR family transcriptional regulator
MDDIALELEATKGLLYYYFPTKENLLSAVLEQSALIDEIEAAVRSLRTQSFPSAVRTGIYGAMDLMRANEAFIRFLHVQTLLSTREAELVYATVYERLYRALAAEVDYFKGTGEVRSDVNSLHWARMLVDLAAICFLHAQAAPETHAIDNRYLDSMVGNLIAASAVEWPASGASAPALAREPAEAAEPRN